MFNKPLSEINQWAVVIMTWLTVLLTLFTTITANLALCRHHLKDYSVAAQPLLQLMQIISVHIGEISKTAARGKHQAVTARWVTGDRPIRSKKHSCSSKGGTRVFFIKQPSQSLEFCLPALLIKRWSHSLNSRESFKYIKQPESIQYQFWDQFWIS